MIRVINRHGIIIPEYSTENQCGNQDENSCYHYECKIAFNKNVPLNDNGWIVDHVDIDRSIKRTITGSCEEMANVMVTSVVDNLMNKGLGRYILGIKLTIMFNNNQGVTNGAFFEVYKVYNDDPVTYIVLNS